MPRVRTIEFLCFVAILGGVLGYAFRRPIHPVTKEEEAVRLWIPPDALNLGTVWEDDRFAWTVLIENQEAVPIEVTSFTHSCNCLSVKPEAFVLQPDERQKLDMQIDLLAKQTKPGGEVSIALSPHLKTMPGTEMAKRRPPQWTVTGHVRRVLALDRSVYLGRHSELSQLLPVQEIRLEVLVPLESLSVECVLANFTASVGLPSRGQGKTVLRLAPSPSLPVGPIQGTIKLKPVSEDGKPLPTRQLDITGTIVPDVESVPPAVQVGGRRLGETFEQVIVLRSMRGRVLGPVRAEAEGEGLTVEATKEGVGYRIRQKVCSEGLRTNWVRFTTESGKHLAVVAVAVSYTGIDVK